MQDGMAEIFGSELVKEKRYEFTSGAKVAVFTWQGCVIKLVGKIDGSYIAKETPMNIYLNCHAVMEGMREVAENKNSKGPVVMVVGPCDVGKSTLCRMLLNYAVRMGRRPIYVDLNVEHGHVSVPGTVGAFLVERLADITHGFNQKNPSVFHFGHKAPTSNVALYNCIVKKLAEVCSDRMEANKRAKVSGIVIDTCGWRKEGGYETLTSAAQAFQVDAILVLDQERLYNELIRDMPEFVNIVFLPKSGGVVEKSVAQKVEAREKAVREYFYGSKVPLYPHSIEMKWSEAKIFKIGAPTLPSSCLPVGMETEDQSKKLVSVTAGPNLIHHVLSVSFADPANDDVVQTNVVGFVCVYVHDFYLYQ